MIIEPKIRGFICTTAHPDGCAKHVQDQIDYVKSQEPVTNGPKKVLVIGASTGYGLSSRIMTAFGGSKAATMGVFFEKAAEGKRTASAGWYNSAAFEEKAKDAGLYARSFNGDAFSDEMRTQVIEAIKADLGQIDMVIYSLASPRRQHPRTGEVYRSVLKPIGKSYTNTSINMMEERLEEVSLEIATAEEIDHTEKVMGGEDWSFWIDALNEAGVLAHGVTTVAYTYIGPRVTQDVYRQGTIGNAKDHLESTASVLNEKLKGINGRAFISSNKALVTQSSSAIPFIPLYFVILTKIMQKKGIEEDCIQQIYRLFAGRLYAEKLIVDEKGFIRLDDLELREDVQQEVDVNWDKLSQELLHDLADIPRYHKDFLRL
ncbi:MAG: enoyl-[acyl-carrier protein] reductase/trans-2-enoyl-CoA reductase (NAD+), partial [Candidatus Omnitrophota bacterium]